MKAFALVALVALVALAACKPGAERRADSPGVQPVDTLKPVAATDTLPSAPKVVDSTVGKGAPPTSTKAAPSKAKLGRDSAFPPPSNLPQLDTVRRKRPPTA